MQKLVGLIVVATLVLGARAAHARDHQELVCAGVAAAKDGGEGMPVFIHFFESRAKDGESRDEVSSTEVAGKLYTSKWLNKTGDFAKDAPLTLKAGNRVYIKGKYSVVQSGDSYTLKITGKLDKRDLDATLPCTDLSI